MGRAGRTGHGAQRARDGIDGQPVRTGQVGQAPADAGRAGVTGDNAVGRKPEDEGITGNRGDRRRRGEHHALPDLRSGALRGSHSRPA